MKLSLSSHPRPLFFNHSFKLATFPFIEFFLIFFAFTSTCFAIEVPKLSAVELPELTIQHTAFYKTAQAHQKSPYPEVQAAAQALLHGPIPITEKAYLQLVKALVDAHGDLEICSENGDTMLHEAVNYGYQQTVEVLLGAGASTQIKNNQGLFPLHIAVDKLLSQKMIPVRAFLAVYQNVMHSGLDKRTLILKNLLDSGANLDGKNAEGDTVLHCAVRAKRYDLIEIFLSRGIDPNLENQAGNTPLHIAARLHDAKAVELLLANGSKANVKNVRGFTPMEEAAELFLAPHSTLQNLHKRFLTTADLLLLKNLVAHGAVINARNDAGETLLHRAASSGEIKLVEHLLAAGISCNLENQDGQTPLHLALQYSPPAQYSVFRIACRFKAMNRQKVRDQMIRSLLKYGASAQVGDLKGNTPLHEATRPSDVPLLLRAGADIHARNHIGDTPLHRAVRRDNYPLVKMLLASGAAVESKNNQGQTALDLAIARIHQAALEKIKIDSRWVKVNDQIVKELTRRSSEAHLSTAAATLRPL